MRFHKENANTEAETAAGRSPLAARIAKQLTERPALPDENAYRLIEEARLRCQRRLQKCIGEAERARWTSVHRELGMAGYLASGEIPPNKRVELLARARER